MVRHIVCWKLKENEQGNKLDEMKKKLEGLKARIGQIQQLYVGINDIAAPLGNWDIVLISDFKNFEDLSAYQNHEAHLEIAAYIKRMTEQRAAVDFVY